MEPAPMRRNIPTMKALHPAVYGALVLCTLWILAAIWAFFASNLYAGLQLAVATFFGAVFLITPYLLARMGGAARETPAAFREWAEAEFETADGRIEARHAAAMVLVAPVAVALGITAIGFVARLAALGAI